MATEDNNIHSIDFLRAFASLSVCWYHYIYYTPDFLPDTNWIKQTGKYGFLGVQIFFVISGFIIPWSMQKAKYVIQNYKRFIYKRAVRIEPPYILTIILTVILAYVSTLSPYYRGLPFQFSMTQILLHIGYLNVFMPDPKWLNASFWTLAIEFQYYVLIGLLFPLLVHSKRIFRMLVVVLFAFSFLIYDSNDFITNFGPLFLAGFLTFQYKTKIIGKKEFILLLSSCVLIILYFINLRYALVASFTVLTILFLQVKNRVITFLASISYSLYLLHPIIGQRVVNISTNFVHNEYARVGVAMLAVGISIFASYIMYRLIEKPFQRISHNIRYSDVPAQLSAEITSESAKKD